jgi:hypothetical protein
MRGCLSGLLFVAPVIPIVLVLALLFGNRGGMASFVLFWVSWFALGSWLANKARKDYLVALTDRRLIVLTLKSPMWFHVDFSRSVAQRSFDRSSLPSVTSDVSPRRVRIKLAHPAEGFDAVFPGGRFGDSYAHAGKIAEALRGNVASAA